MAVMSEVSVWLQSHEIIRLTISSLTRAGHRKLATCIELIQTCIGEPRDLNLSNIVNILHQMLDQGQRGCSVIHFFPAGFYPVQSMKLWAVC